jgi:hypothetical protein
VTVFRKKRKKLEMDWLEKNEAAAPETPKAEGYEAPQVVRVSLRPAEAVLGHCKVSGSAGPVSASCRPLSGPCRTPGS